jgi:hypothetical protein
MKDNKKQLKTETYMDTEMVLSRPSRRARHYTLIRFAVAAVVAIAIVIAGSRIIISTTTVTTINNIITITNITVAIAMIVVITN